MKVTFALALAAVCIIVLCNDAAASPSDMEKAKDKSKDPAGTIKDAKAAGKDAKKKCAIDCEAGYDPICAHDPANPNFKPRTFGTQCAMDVVNCEIGTKLVVKSKGECPGAGGVRLS